MAAFDTEREYARRTLEAQSLNLDRDYRTAVKQQKAPVTDPREFIERRKRMSEMEGMRRTYKNNLERYVHTVNSHKGPGASSKAEVRIPTKHHTAALGAASQVGLYRGYVKAFDRQPSDKSVKHYYRHEAVRLAKEYNAKEAELVPSGSDRHTIRRSALKTIRDMDFDLNRRASAIKVGSIRYMGLRQKGDGDKSLKAALNEMSHRKKSAKAAAQRILYQSSIP